MGVLNKLKGRMSSYRGPTQTDMSSPVFGFDTGRKPSSGVDAVNAGLAAAASAAPVASNIGQQIADAGSTLGKAIGIAYGNKETKSKRLKDKSEAVAKRGRKAVDEGRDRKGNRLLTRAATLEDRSIDAEEKEYFKKHGKRKPIEVSSLESGGIAGSFTGFLEKDKTKEKKFGDRFANAPIINENLM